MVEASVVCGEVVSGDVVSGDVVAGDVVPGGSVLPGTVLEVVAATASSSLEQATAANPNTATARAPFPRSITKARRLMLITVLPPTCCERTARTKGRRAGFASVVA